MRRKCEYGVFQITNAKNLVKSRVEDKWFVRNFWHEWFGKPHTHNSDLTVLTLLKTTNIYKVRKSSWNCNKVLSKTHVHTLQWFDNFFGNFAVKCEYEFYCHFVKCEHGFLFHSFAISVAFNNAGCCQQTFEYKKFVDNASSKLSRQQFEFS